MGLGIVLVWNIGYGMIMTSKFLCALGGVRWPVSMGHRDIGEGPASLIAPRDIEEEP